MSSLTTTTVNTKDGTTDLTLTTGNSTSASIVLRTNGTLSVKANSTINSISVNTTNITTNTGSFTANGNMSVNGTFSVTGNSTLTGNTTVAASLTVANVLTVTNSAIFVTNSVTMGAYSATATQFANGYSRLPNGLLLQWGTVAANQTVGSVTFPAAFSPVFSMTVSANDKSTTCMAAVTALTNTTATVLLSSNVSTRTVYWQAIGL